MSTNTGAQWMKCDLHVHTPFDKTKKFGEDIKAAEEAFKNGDTSRIKTMAYKFFEACHNSLLDLVAITDHNTLKGFRYFDPFLAEWSRETGNNLILIPGIELTVGGERNLHALVLVEKNIDLDLLERYITALFDGKQAFDKKGLPISCGKDLGAFLFFSRSFFDDSRISFLMIPAHINRNSGVDSETRYETPSEWEAELKGALRVRAFAQKTWAGFQVKGDVRGIPDIQKLLWEWAAAFYYRRSFEDLSDKEQQRIKNRSYWPLIEASDPDKYEKIGDSYTWMKIGIPDIEGIRLALIDPESRMRCLGTSKPIQNYAKINSIRISNTDFVETLEIPFNPGLNTIIGGRGCGKSALIELIRFTLDRAQSTDFEEDELEIKNYVLDLLKEKVERDFGNTKGMLIDNYQIELEIEVAGRIYRVHRSKKGIAIRTDDPNIDPSLLDVRTLILPRIFSQRQIGRIAKDPTAQRREIDALIERDFYRNFQDRLRILVSEIKKLQAQRNQISVEIETLPERETELQKVKDQIAFLENSSNAEITEKYKTYKGEEKWIDQIITDIQQISFLLRGASSQSIQLANVYSGPLTGPTMDWTNQIREKLRTTLLETSRMIDEQMSKYIQLENEVNDGKINIWASQFELVDAAYQDLLKSMQTQDVAFHQHPLLVEKQNRLEEEIRQLKEQASKLSSLNMSINDYREKLVELYKERYRRRYEFSQHMETQNTDIRLEIKPFGDRKSLIEKRDEWFGGSGFQKDDWKVLVDYIYKTDQGSEIPTRLWTVVSNMREDIAATRKNGHPLISVESKVCSTLGLDADDLTGHFFNALEKGEKIQIDDIELFIPDDFVSSSVRDSHGNWKPIDQGSIGLKSTAIISLLLSSGDQPLIIDQPEDELDNKYVYDVIVNLLRKCKFSRQIIIATHNANVPVNGDAEMIIALGVENRLGNVEALGSIDHKEVKQVVSEVMEGSAEAFRLRRERYGY